MIVTIISISWGLALMQTFTEAADVTEADTEFSVPSQSPVHPTEDQQVSQIWGAREVLRCPEGTGLLLKRQVSPEGATTLPVCVPMVSPESPRGVSQ